MHGSRRRWPKFRNIVTKTKIGNEMSSRYRILDGLIKQYYWHVCVLERSNMSDPAFSVIIPSLTPRFERDKTDSFEQ